GPLARPDRLGRPLPGTDARRARQRHRRGGAGAPDLEHGAEDHDRLGDARQQGPRADRGPFSVRPPVRADRGRRPPDVGRPRARPLPGRRRARPPRLPAPAARARGRRARRDLSLRLQRGQRGRGRRVPGRPRAVPGHRRGGRGGPRGGRRRAGPGPRRAGRCRRRGPPSRRGAAEGAGVNVFVAILGLAFLILIHEAGHFFAAIAVGMRPRRFYIGFPPAVVKTVRNGIEYGIGAVPLGGYVKIPGMHRPAPADADVQFGRALHERPELAGPLQRLKRALAAGDDPAADAALEELMRLGGDPPPAGLSHGIQEILDGISPQAYWRQDTWRRVFVILAGPATNFVLAVALFTVLFLVGGGKATTTVGSVLAGKPAAAIGLHPGDQIVTINRQAVGPTDISAAISGSKGKSVTLTVVRGTRYLTLGPARPQVIDGAYRLGFVLRGQELGF